MNGNCLLIENCAAVYSPNEKNEKKTSIFIAGGEIIGFFDGEEDAEVLKALRTVSRRVVDGRGMVVVPGFVDIHVHLIGGGGEMGPESRTCEAELSELVQSGLTTVVGVLGTDDVTRSLQALLSKCLALRRLHLNAFMYTGSYTCPPCTISGSVVSDIALFDPIIGVGEIAISDHRGSQPSHSELSRVIADAGRGGLLKGHSGVAYFHIGRSNHALSPLKAIVDEGILPISSILPTHCNRSGQLKNEAVEWMRRGGMADFTIYGDAVDQLAKMLKDDDLCAIVKDKLSISSDAYGSLPEFDEAGNIIAYGAASPASCLRAVQELTLKHGLPLQLVLPLITINPAKAVGIPQGFLAPGQSADFLLLESTSLSLEYVFCKGEMLKSKDTEVFQQFKRPKI